MVPVAGSGRGDAISRIDVLCLLFLDLVLVDDGKLCVVKNRRKDVRDVFSLGEMDGGFVALDVRKDASLNECLREYLDVS